MFLFPETKKYFGVFFAHTESFDERKWEKKNANRRQCCAHSVSHHFFPSHAAHMHTFLCMKNTEYTIIHIENDYSTFAFFLCETWSGLSLARDTSCILKNMVFGAKKICSAFFLSFSPSLTRFWTHNQTKHIKMSQWVCEIHRDTGKKTTYKME